MTRKSKLQAFIGAIIAIILLTIGIIVANNNSQNKTAIKIEYSDTDHSATMTIGEDDVANETSDIYGLGELGEEIEIDDIRTVESVESGQEYVVNPVPDEDLSGTIVDGEGTLGAFIAADVSSPSAFKNDTLGKCYNTDWNSTNYGYYEQCWDLADVFWQNTVGRRHSACGTGVAKGAIMDGCWQKNAGNEFMMIWDPTKLKAGDWIIFTNGQTGHVGMAVGSYNNGYITLLGQNQGGGLCPGSTMGARTNIINISLKDFGGAFRYKPYEEARLKAEEEAKKKTEESKKKPSTNPAVTPVSTDEYTVQRGDTLGGIIRKMGWYNGKDLYGDDGYAQKVANANGIKNRGLIYPGQIIRRIYAH